MLSEDGIFIEPISYICFCDSQKLECMETKDDGVEVKVTIFNTIPIINLYTFFFFFALPPPPNTVLISVVLASRGGNVENGN